MRTVVRMAEKKVCEDLVKERKKCTFNVEELTRLIDGGEDKTMERREVGKWRSSVVFFESQFLLFSSKVEKLMSTNHCVVRVCAKRNIY